MRSGFLGVLFVGLVAIVAGLVGYQVGLASTAVEAGRTVVVGGWFPGFGFLFFLFFLFVLFSFAGRRRYWGGGHGYWGQGYGRGPWGGPTGMTGPDASTDPRQQWIADYHKGLHEAESKPGAPTSPTDPTNRGAAG